MLSKTLLLALLPALAVSQSVFDVNVGKGGYIFQPNTLTAQPGDMIRFHFYPSLHSVAQSTYSKPCVPSGPNAVFSGFFTQPSGVDDMMWTLTVNSTAPLWLYCAQIAHCQSGMAMVVNPPKSGDSIAGYIKAATRAPVGVSPPKVQGGVISPNQAVAKPIPKPTITPTIHTGLSLNQITMLRKAHGSIMATTVILLLPIGALFMRLLGFKGLVWLHAAWQLTSLCLLTAGFGIGSYLANDLHIRYVSFGKTHTTFGTILFCLFWIQPFLGYAHHSMFKKKQSRTPVSYVHIWYGRLLFVLAIINGGLGLQLAARIGGDTTPMATQTAYGVVAGVMFVIYVAVAIFGELRRSRRNKTTSGREVKTFRGANAT